MSNSIPVDFIVLSWNRTEETIAAIESARAQKGVVGSVKVVDQGSEPQNLARMRAYVAGTDNVILMELGRNVGVPAGRNIATEMGNAPFVIAIDNDAEFADDTCALRAIELMEADVALAVIAFRILNYFTRQDDESSWGYPGVLLASRGSAFFTSRFVGAGHAIRRTAFQSIGGYDNELFFACEEVDLGLRLLNAGYRIRYDASIEILHKVSPEGRLKWSAGRFYYSVRNRIYIHYKSGSSLRRITQYAAGRLVAAWRNGLTLECLRALRDAAAMCWRYRPDSEQRRLAHLRKEVREYIQIIDRVEDYTLWSRFKNAFGQRLTSINK